MTLLRRLTRRTRSTGDGSDGAGRPVALVYRGPAARPAACSDAVAELLASSRHGFDVRWVGPREELGLTPATLAGATLYAQPGGGTLDQGWKRMRGSADAVRGFVAGGGRYLGFCLGGYLAGATPGFGLLPGDTDRWIDTDGATVRHDDDALVDVRWGAATRSVFFQDGPHFLLDPDPGAGCAASPAPPVQVLGRYPNGALAAVVTSFGQGRVGVVGPHPEASRDWFSDAGLPPTDARDLGRQLIDEVMVPVCGSDLAEGGR